MGARPRPGSRAASTGSGWGRTATRSSGRCGCRATRRSTSRWSAPSTSPSCSAVSRPWRSPSWWWAGRRCAGGCSGGGRSVTEYEHARRRGPQGPGAADAADLLRARDERGRDRRGVVGRGLLEVAHVHQVDAEVAGDRRDHGLLAPRPAGVHAERLDARALGADAVLVDLDLAPRGDHAGDALEVDLRRVVVRVEVAVDAAA